MEGEDGGSRKVHRKRAAGPKALKKKKPKRGMDDTEKKKKPKDESLTAKQRNPKAFATQSVNKLRKQVARSQDKAENRLHPLDVDQSSAEPPPICIAVVGPPKVGKSTLIRCLIRNYTKRKINNIKGPVTIVTGKKQRVTLIECNNDISSMIDCSKICDLALLLIDANSFEMEVMEFLEMCRTHGMPKVIGVLTHLDMIKNAKQLQKKKKEMKQRVWTELHQGAKLFYLSGVINGDYQKTEVRNLARFISVQKFRPIEWRSSHPYIIADRIEDVTDPETLRLNPKVDRKVCLYGYVRGTHFRNKAEIHIPGCGDLRIHDMSVLPDPCPLSLKIKKRSLDEKDRIVYAPFSGVNGVICDKDAFYIELGGSHALRPATESDPVKPSDALVQSMLGTQTTVDDKLAGSGLRLFSDMAPVSAKDLLRSNKLDDEDDDDESMDGSDDDDDDDENEDDDNDNDDDDNDDDDDENEDDENDDDDENENENENDEESDMDDDETLPLAKKPKKKESSDDEDDDESGSGSDKSEREEEEDMDFNDDDDDDNDDDEDDNDDDDDDDDEDNPKWKSDLSRRATEEFARRKAQTVNWEALVYNSEDKVAPGKSNKEDDDDGDDDNATIGGIFKVMKDTSTAAGQIDDTEETTRPNIDVKTFDEKLLSMAVADCFVTGKWDKNEDAKTRLEKNESDEVYSDFEDLETGVVHRKGTKDKADESDAYSGDSSEGENGSADEAADKEMAHENETAAEKRTRMVAEKRLKKKALTKAMFDSEYDQTSGAKTHYEQQREELKQQAEVNRSEFEGLSEEARCEYEGFRPGLYVRVQINNVTCELIENFDPTYPLIVGGLKTGEQSVGYVNVRVKKHRWHKKQLKSTDPLIVSLGWRRFQTIGIFSRRDDNGKYRYMKYTPHHIHCFMTFWGPITPKGRGMLTVRTLGRDFPGFRISITGTVLGDDKTVSVEKKLRLMGTPFKVYTKTAFIKDMFTSSREVSKFIGGRIQTVSKIRGEIKKAITDGGEGSFRATFEDKILLSDLVMFNTWTKIHIPEFYNLVTTLLLPPSEKNKWMEMKTVGELRREQNLRRDVNRENLYLPNIRTEKAEKAFTIPRELQKRLPFKDKPKMLSTKKDEVQSKRIAVVREPKESKVANMMKMFTKIYENKRKQDRMAMRHRAAAHQKQQAKIDASKAVKQKERAKHAYYLLGQAEKRKLANKRD